jgi:predicted nuclease of restriction endonuclease-like RecB superfamily
VSHSDLSINEQQKAEEQMYLSNVICNVKDWVVTVEEQYLSALAFYYIPDKEIPKAEVTKENLFTNHIAITAWTKHKFGEFWTEEVEKDCRTKGSHLNILFQKEIFDTEEIPEYILHAVYGG